MNLKNTETTLLHPDWFYDVLDLDLKGAWSTLRDLDWFYNIGIGLEKHLDYLDLDWFYYTLRLIELINQAGMSLEKCEYI